MKSASELASELVAIPSPNPGPLAMGQEPSCEAEVAAFVAELLESLGLEVTRQSVTPGRDNILATLPGRTDARLLLDAHMDTVPGENMDIEPFSGEIVDGRIYGRGAADTKGTLAAMLHALGILAGDPEGPLPTVTFVGSVDEEAGFSGIYKLAQSGVQADAALIGEPTGLALVTATRGVARWQIETHGVAAHTCHPERGVNAIYKMTDVISALRRRVMDSFAERRHPLLGSPQMTVSIIRGGRRCNIVPDECTIDIDRRLLPGETQEDAVGEVEAVLADLRAADPELDVEMLKPYTFVPGIEIAEDAPIVQAACRAAEDAGVSPRIAGVPFTTHASVLSQRGIPCLVFGAGKAEQAHAATEYVGVEEVEKAADVIVGLCKSFGG